MPAQGFKDKKEAIGRCQEGAWYFLLFFALGGMVAAMRLQ
jgi:hypothetical protein